MLSSSVVWLSELEVEDPTFIHQFQLNLFDDLNTKEIAASHEQDLEHSFSTESYSSYPTLNTRNNNTTTTFSYSILEDSKTTADRHAKQPKTDSLNSSTTQHISTHDAPAKLLSFGKSGSRPNTEQFYSDLVGTAQPKEDMISTRNMPFPSKNMISQFSSKVNQNSVYNTSQGTKRTTSQDHIIAERKRRQKLNQRFIALSAIVPGLQKTDKATVLGDAIKYLKTLQERVKSLEEQTEKKTMESVIFIRKSQLSADDDENSAGHSDGPPLEIEARISGKNILIRIHCEKNKEIIVKTLAEMEKFHLTVVNSSAIPFGNSALDITLVAQMDVEFSMTVKDLMRNLRSTFLQLMCKVGITESNSCM